MIHKWLWQWCKDYWIDTWSIAWQNENYKILYIVMSFYQLSTFMRNMGDLLQHEDWYFTDKYEWLETPKWKVVFMFVDQCVD